MAVALRSVGTVATAASGNVTPGLPAGWQPNDICIVFVTQHDNIASTIAAGWTIVDAANNTTAHRAWWAWRRMVAGDAAPLITHAAGDAIVARIAAFSGCVTSGTPYAENLAQNNASSTNVATPSRNAASGEFYIVFGASSDDSTWTAPTGSPTYNEFIDNLTSLALDASMGAYWRIETSTNTASPTMVQSRTVISRGFNFRLIEAPANNLVNAYWGARLK